MENMAVSVRKPNPDVIPATLLDEAKRLGVDVAGCSEAEVRRALRAAWIEENHAAIESSNAWVEKHGLPLEKYRQF